MSCALQRGCRSAKHLQSNWAVEIDEPPLRSTLFASARPFQMLPWWNDIPHTWPQPASGRPRNCNCNGMSKASVPHNSRSTASVQHGIARNTHSNVQAVGTLENTIYATQRTPAHGIAMSYVFGSRWAANACFLKEYSFPMSAKSSHFDAQASKNTMHVAHLARSCPQQKWEGRIQQTTHTSPTTPDASMVI